MFKSPIIELAIAISLVYLLLSVLVALLNELRVYIRKIRGKCLRHAIEEVFNDGEFNKNYAQLLYDHPLIDRMKKTQKDLPAYLSSSVVASSLVDVISNESCELRAVQDPTTLKVTMMEVNKDDGLPREADPYARFKKGIAAMRHSDIKVLLNGFAEQSTDLESLKSSIEKWFNDYMDRVTGWYKNAMQKWLFWIGFGVAVAMNVDSIHLARELYKNNELRTKLADAGQSYTEQNPQLARTPQSLDSLIRSMDSIYTQLGAYNLPVGWNFLSEDVNSKPLASDRAYEHFRRTFWGWVVRLLGWLITAAAVSFGAPFWFEALNKIVNIRRSGKKPTVTPPAT